MTMSARCLGAVCGVWIGLLSGVANAANLPAWDFTVPAQAAGWQPAHDLTHWLRTTNGLEATITGVDPYLYGPARNYPVGVLLWLNLRLKSDQAGACQVFYFPDQATEEKSVRFQVPAGQWVEARVPVPALDAGYHLRIDPPGQGGNWVLGRLWFEERIILALPVWPRPTEPVMGAAARPVASGLLRLTQNADALGGFEVRVGETKMAVGHNQGMIGYLDGKQTHWLRLTNGPANPLRIEVQTNDLHLQAEYADDQGGVWTFRQRFQPAESNTIWVESSVAVNQSRQVVYLPMFTLLPGMGSFGTNKHQGLFAGLEYLENEPSSSEADLKGPTARRQTPDTLKITFPLMAIQAGDGYVGFTWEPDPRFAALFDSPDRQFGSGGHLMGVIFPGSDGVNRAEGDLLPYAGQWLAANTALVFKGAIIGGYGKSIIPAVQQYVSLKGLPPIPDPHLALPDYARLAAHGWLDTSIRATNLYRHAAWPGFAPQPAADAALWMGWLAGKVDDAGLASRLVQAGDAALAQVPGFTYNSYQVGHVRSPAPALVSGDPVAEAMEAESQAVTFLRQFAAYGTLYYRAGKVDYGSTHWTNEANGLTAATLLRVLEAAAFSGNRNLTQEGLKHLQGMKKYAHTVPRGAQTWEIPLHTPDILASAYLVRAYTLGYELSGDPEFLEAARYWAWTGVPFVYLTPPTAQPVGLYGTIAVLGATGWVAPVWMGLPVQWCGLVYADALYRFARHDPTGPWLQLARGITVAGVQFTWPESDAARQGLLPDSYLLRSQTSDGPPINPATLLACAALYYEQPAFYDLRSFLRHGLVAHAPGTIEAVVELPEGIAFHVRGWSPKPYHVLVTGVWTKPRVKIDGKSVPLAGPHQYDPDSGRLKLQVSGHPSIEITHPATGALRIDRGVSPGTLIIQWPSQASNYVLETTSPLRDLSDWVLASGAMSNVSGFYLTANTAADRQRNYRLRLNP